MDTVDGAKTCPECEGAGFVQHDCGEDSCCCWPRPDVDECERCYGSGSLLVLSEDLVDYQYQERRSDGA